MAEKTREALIVELADAHSEIKKFKDEKRLDYIKQIKRFGDKYSDEELESKDLESLKTIHDAVSRFYDELNTKDDEVEKIPMRTKIRKDHRPEERIDFSKTFEDVNEQFNMSGIR